MKERFFMIATEKSKVRYVADGVASTFPVDFKFFKTIAGKAELGVYINSGNETKTLSEGSDYTIVGVGEAEGGGVIFAEVPEENTKISIVRRVPLLQDDNYINGQFLDLEEIERSFDKAYMALQDIAEKVSRAILIDELSDDNPLEIVGQVIEYRDAAILAANAAKDYAEQTQVKIDAANQLIEQAQGLIDSIGYEIDTISGEVV